MRFQPRLRSWQRSRTRCFAPTLRIRHYNSSCLVAARCTASESVCTIVLSAFREKKAFIGSGLEVTQNTTDSSAAEVDA